MLPASGYKLTLSLPFSPPLTSISPQNTTYVEYVTTHSILSLHANSHVSSPSHFIKHCLSHSFVTSCHFITFVLVCWQWNIHKINHLHNIKIPNTISGHLLYPICLSNIIFPKDPFPGDML